MYNHRSGHPRHSYDHSSSDYFRDANRANGQPYYFRQHNLIATTVNPAQQLAAVRMSQAGYNSNASGTSGGGHSMQPSHAPQHHQASSQQQQPMPQHAAMSYHQQQQQQPSGPPYVIGPGQYSNTQQFTYRQQQPNSYQQHQSPTQQQQQPGRPTFVGINAIPTSGTPRVPTSHPSATPYLVQQQQTSSIRMPQQQQQALSGGMQQSQPQASFMTPRSVAVSIAHHQGPQQLITTGHVQQHLIRVQQPQQQQSPQQQQVNVRMPGGPGQVQVIATSANTGLMMPAQYTQGVYQRPVILQQQPIVVQQPPSQQQQTGAIINSQQQPQTTIQYQYKQPQQTLASQLQQGPQQLSVLPKQQPAPSPSSISSSASSTPAQFAAPNQIITKSEFPAGLNSSSSPATISAAANQGASASNAISDSASAGSSGAQSDSSQVLTKQRLEDLVREVDPYEQLDEDVKETLLHIADEFIESVVSGACQIAKHRKAASVDVKDVQLCLERNWNMWIPGFGTDDVRPYKKACVTDAHKQRTALIKKTMKKI